MISEKVDLANFIPREIAKNYVEDHLHIKLFDYQLDIIEHMLNLDIKKVSIRATTRAGKSYAVAIGAILYAIFVHGSKIGIIAPSRDKTKIIMTYIQQFLADSDLDNLVDLDVMGLSKLERLKKEVSKSKITFKTGSYIEVKTADVKGGGFSVMGAGYHLTIIDETAELTSTVWSKIYRMLVDSPESKIVEIGNPWFLNHFYEHMFDPTWVVLHIPWTVAVAQGRMRAEDIEDQRVNLTEAEFDVLFNANFPKQIQQSLFIYEDLMAAKREINLPKEKPTKILGIDVARMGDDLTVIFEIHQYSSLFVVVNSWSFSKQKLTKTAGDIISIMNNTSIDIIKMDSTGLGSGLDDMLSEYLDNNDLSTELVSIVFSERANDERNTNRKADIFFNLSKLFREKQIIIPSDDNGLFMQLRRMQYEMTSNGKKKIIDGQEKSPDCFIAGTKVLTSKGYKNIEHIDYNDKIITPYGIRNVIYKVTKETDTLVHIKFNNGKELYTTPNHKLFVNNQFKKASNLNINDRINTDSLGSLILWRLKNLLNTKIKNIGFRQRHDTTMQMSMMEQVKEGVKRKDYIDKYMKTLLVKESQKDMWYTILMGITLIIILKTWLWLKDVSTKVIMLLNYIKINYIDKIIKKFLILLGIKLKNGMPQKKVFNGTETTTINHLKKLNYIIKPVCTVDKNIKLQEKQNHFTVVKSVVGCIETIHLDKPIKVYNITVSKDNVYYANSILVSNCADALAIGCYAYNDGIVIDFG